MIVPIRNDVAESMVPWYAHTYSSKRVPIETITAIKEAIPARLPTAIIFTPSILKTITKKSVITQVGGNFIIAGECHCQADVGWKLQEIDQMRRPHQGLSLTIFKQLSIWIWWNTSDMGLKCPLFCMYFPSNQTFSYSSETQDLGKVSMILLRPVWASVYATQHKKYMEWGQNSDWSLSGNPSLHLLNTSQENVLNVRSTDGCWTHWTHSRCFKYCSMKQLSIQCIYIGVLWRRFKNFCHAHSFISAFEP